MLSAYYYVLILGIAACGNGLGNLLMASESKPVLVPKTNPRRSENGQGCPYYAQLIYAMLKHRIIHVPTRYRLLLLHFEYTFVIMNYSLCHSRRPSGTVTAVSLWQWQLFGISCQTLLGGSRHYHFSEPI